MKRSSGLTISPDFKLLRRLGSRFAPFRRRALSAAKTFSAATFPSTTTDQVLKIRLIPCLDVKDGRVVKGVKFVELRDAGDPVEIAKRYDEAGADEVTFLDITASSDARDTIVEVIARVADQVFIPLTVGGGVRAVQDVRTLLNAGADKVSINTAAVEEPDLVRRAAAR